MKRTLKTVLLLIGTMILLAALAVGVFTSSAAAGTDPADSYKKQTAPYEDSSISMWFEHSFKKVLTSDKTHSGMDTYSIYMAKNEIENAQFVLYSDTTKTGLTASVTEFSDGKGNTIPASIYYQMYVTVEDVLHNNLYGQTSSSQDFIREGEVPDPMVPLAALNRTGKFQLNGGKSQAFYIRTTTDENTPSGWYLAQLDIKNSSGQIVKTATVFCYVWDFTISEKTELQTSFIIDNNASYGGSYQTFYDYLLENRLCGTDVPGKLTSDNPYLTNPRVSAIRVSGYIEAGGASGSRYCDQQEHYPYYRDIYNRLYCSDIWDEVEDKLYFYDTDEPLPVENVGNARDTVDSAYISRAGIDKYWGGENPRIVIPHGENHPYPYWTFTNEVRPLSSFSTSVLTDAEAAMFEDNLCTVWCPRMYGFTPMSAISTINYTGKETSIIRTNSGPYSGNIMKYAYDYYIWENIYGEFTDRVKSEIATDSEDIELWAYSAGFNKGYTYANHIIENTGLQTKMMFWQLYQEDCTGYLYYATNNWKEQDHATGTEIVDNTPTGSFTNTKWKTNKWYLSPETSTGKYIYGNGVLFYGRQQAGVSGVPNCIGTIRVEMMRDGVEEYQMLTMIEDLLGEKAAKDIVKKVSTNVVSYLSLPTFSTAGWSSSMDEYDIMAKVRKDMGNTLEAAVAKGQCDHSWDGGRVTTEATCLKIGYKTYTCTKCSAQKDEYIPAHHTVGSCFKKVSGTAATCTQDGNEVYKCTICSFERNVTTTAFHKDTDYYRYEPHSVNEKSHNIYCTVCNGKVDAAEHVSFNVNTATCDENGEIKNTCRYCGYAVSIGVATQAKGHDYVNGICTVCGENEFVPEPEPEYVLGDANGDGSVKGADSLIAKRIAAGIDTPDARQEKALDVNGDGKINFTDTNLISRYIAGIIFEFPISK